VPSVRQTSEPPHSKVEKQRPPVERATQRPPVQGMSPQQSEDVRHTPAAATQQLSAAPEDWRAHWRPPQQRLAAVEPVLQDSSHSTQVSMSSQRPAMHWIDMSVAALQQGAVVPQPVRRGWQ
jgi:hypothetical protein